MDPQIYTNPHKFDPSRWDVGLQKLNPFHDINEHELKRLMVRAELQAKSRSLHTIWNGEGILSRKRAGQA